MNLLQAAAVAYLPFLVGAYYPFKGVSKSTSSMEARGELIATPEFNPYELLNTRKPEIYNDAMLELKEFEKEPVCHRVAAQLLINNCQDVEKTKEGDYRLKGDQLQGHHVQSFAASLTICDLEQGGFVIPHECTLFSSSALLRASRDAKNKLNLSPDQVGACLVALGENHSYWNTWLSRRDKGLLFCGAARLDIDKDQAIFQQKRLTQIMADFADGLDHDLRKIKEDMAEHARSADSYFEGVKAHADHLKIKLRDSMEAITTDFKEAASTAKSSLSSTLDLQRMLKNLVDMVIQSNAEMASEQQKALSVNTHGTKSQLESLNSLAVQTEATMAEVRQSMLLLMPLIRSLSERQDALDQRSETLYLSILNMATLIHNHTDDLEQASFTAFRIHETLENASTAAESWKGALSSTHSIADWGLRIGGLVGGVLLGGYGLPPSLFRNIQLLLGGYLSAEMIVQLRYLDWQPIVSWRWSPEVLTKARSFTQQATPVAEFRVAAEYEQHSNMI